jgi:ATP-dependent Lhr-like helicase
MQALFSPSTQSWFEGAFLQPTEAQVGAWQAIARREHTLVVAPTGSGKTLAAFLSAIDRLAGLPTPSDPGKRCRVLYISPLKALAADVERNLRSPLVGIAQAARRLGLAEPDIQVAMRSGDTTAEDRRAFARRGADILITTPESLFLLLTSAARQALSGVETVIIDEVHAVAATKRGSHLAVSLDRLDALLSEPAQRIGLSATVRPIDEVATFLAGGRPVTVVAPGTVKKLDLSVVVPVEDLTELGDGQIAADSDPRARSSIWPHVESRVLDLIDEHRSTIVFANSRRLAERLTSQLNDLAAERDPERGVVARAHHGSVSREQRQVVEEELKAGRIPAVVATSSLELGIDMGAVDLVIQIESPPSVAAGTQRLGRAGHQVGAESRGVIFPKYRGDLLEAAVVAERIRSGQIEAMRYPRNPLDVLAQQIVAMVSMDTMTVDEVETLIRRSASFASLPRSALDAVLDMLSGRYPSDAFAELRPRLVWDRISGELTGRGGAQRLAVTSGGTIPDRGMFGVFLAGAEAENGRQGKRVGELDEEMVYESRVGEVFLLGSSSWRIEDISHDRVLVTPAPGQVGKMPFWKGDSIGRPAELGRALGAFVRELSGSADAAATERAEAAGLDPWAAANLIAYLAEQKQATGQLPTDKTIVVERFRDELGDWRLVIHSPFGAPVNAPWALAIAAALREQHGMDVQSMHSDDGIVLRLPDTSAEPPGSDLALFDPVEIEAMVTAEVTNSALFASRFRECAARSLLLPKRDPRRRSPLWQQRQRANALMQVAKDYGQFPVVLEALRECLQDVFDMPGLVELMRQLQSRQVRLVEVETTTPSPFAQSLLFGYVGMFIYDADVPLAERRAQALTLDTSLLAELMGSPDLRDLLDDEAIAETIADAQRLSPARQAKGTDATTDLLREIGDLTTGEAEARGALEADLHALSAARRVLSVRIAGQQRWIAIEDAGRVRDALGVALPVGVPEAFTEVLADPLGDLLSRYARTHGPFGVDEPAARLGLGVAVVAAGLQRLVGSGQVVAGEFTATLQGRQYCGATILRTIRRKSLAALRREVEPVPQATLARFLPEWQGVGGNKRVRGLDGLYRVVEQLAGVTVPASALESVVLPARVADYSPAMLDELTSAGDVLWAGSGSLARNDGWLCLAPAEGAAELLPAVNTNGHTPLHAALLALLAGDQARFARSLLEELRAGSYQDVAAEDRTEAAVTSAIWDLVWSGALTNDTLAPVRARLGSGRTAHARKPTAPRARFGRGGRAALLGSARANPTNALPTLPGRWSRLPQRAPDGPRTALLRTEVLLDRYGILTRGAVAAENIAGGFSAVYPVLRQAEETGRYRRGYFIDGLGAAQFGAAGAVDRLRAIASATDSASSAAGEAIVLAATDPANAFGAALAWPARISQPESDNGKRGHQPARKAGALVVLVDGHCVFYVERGGRTLLSFTDDEVLLAHAARALSAAVRDGALGTLHVQTADGERVGSSALASALAAAGFRPSPRGLQLRG